MPNPQTKISMAARSTRRKINDAGIGALENLKAAQKQLVRIAALAGDQSIFINENIPEIILGLELVIDTVDKFTEKL